MTDWQAVSARIKARREAMGLTQEALGRRVGSSSNYVAQVEGGLAISERKLDKYAEALGVSVPFLRYGVADVTDLTLLRETARQEGRREVLAELGAWMGAMLGAVSPETRIAAGALAALADPEQLVPVPRPAAATTPPPPRLEPALGPSGRGGTRGRR